jgi:hypothetical protein
VTLLGVALAILTPVPDVQTLRPHHLAGCWRMTWEEPFTTTWSLDLHADGSYDYEGGGSMRGLWYVRPPCTLVLLEWCGESPPESVTEYVLTLDLTDCRRGVLRGTAAWMRDDGEGGEYREHRTAVKLER